jgi:hypothetical protein
MIIHIKFLSKYELYFIYYYHGIITNLAQRDEAIGLLHTTVCGRTEPCVKHLTSGPRLLTDHHCQVDYPGVPLHRLTLLRIF